MSEELSPEVQFMQQLTILHSFLKTKGKEAYIKPVQQLLLDNQKLYAEVLKLRGELEDVKKRND